MRVLATLCAVLCCVLGCAKKSSTPPAPSWTLDITNEASVSMTELYLVDSSIPWSLENADTNLLVTPLAPSETRSITGLTPGPSYWLAIGFTTASTKVMEHITTPQDGDVVTGVAAPTYCFISS